MATAIRSAVLALGAALALCACRTDARSQTAPVPPPKRSCAGPTDATCGADSYCRVPNATGPTTGGACTVKPQMCPMIFQPVCGMDGKTYPNACHAARAGVNPAHSGACVPPKPAAP
jgi:hypothetical protein